MAKWQGWVRNIKQKAATAASPHNTQAAFIYDSAMHAAKKMGVWV